MKSVGKAQGMPIRFSRIGSGGKFSMNERKRVALKIWCAVWLTIIEVLALLSDKKAAIGQLVDDNELRPLQ